MSLDDALAALARIITDTDHREKFFGAGPGEHARFELDARTYRTLRGIDRTRLDVAGEGFIGKRIERVVSAFPRTLRALATIDPTARSTYLARTAFPTSDANERACFHAFTLAHATTLDRLDIFVQDLVDLELAAYALPANSDVAHVDVTTRGPLVDVFRSLPTLPADYPPAPSRVRLKVDANGLRIAPAAGLLPTVKSAKRHSHDR